VIPPSRPKQSEDDTRTALSEELQKAPVAILGVRGYYRDTMGAPGRNDRGIYDDAIFVVGPGIYVSFSANTDPSIHRRAIAVLAAGTWMYRLGRHGINKEKQGRGKAYPALVQAKAVTVIRDQQGPNTGWFGINIHRGSRTSTSSAGCQTIWPGQWDEFINLVTNLMRKHSLDTIQYKLIERSNA
jgi:lysozyme